MNILIYACTSLAWCSTHTLYVPAEQITLQACGKSQAHVAQWAWEHPEWQVVRWDCRRVELAELLK